MGHTMMMRVVLFMSFALTVLAASKTKATTSTCKQLKDAYKSSSCCSSPTTVTSYTLAGTGTQVVPKPSTSLKGTNVCAGKKPKSGFDNFNCTLNGVLQAFEQAGANVTAGYRGSLNATGRVPITSSYLDAGLCPVNVHWHLGTEHYSAGQYDEFGTGPKEEGLKDDTAADTRRAGEVRVGFRCRYYDTKDKRFTTKYNWKHCDPTTKVGETYEVHWPHSRAGACGTPNQWQTPFYDGVFCMPKVTNTWKDIGVQAQVFTIINDENYYYPDLMRGMIIEGDYGKDMVKYTGSTTGTTRDNTVCSKYAPITWQVDRKCHLISASSFDKMCADMKQQRDDMSGDTHAHGSRKLVADFIAANNQQRRSFFQTEMKDVEESVL